MPLLYCFSELPCCPICLWFPSGSSVVSFLATFGLFCSRPCRRAFFSPPVFHIPFPEALPGSSFALGVLSALLAAQRCWVAPADHCPSCRRGVWTGLPGLSLHVELNQAFFLFNYRVMVKRHLPSMHRPRGLGALCGWICPGWGSALELPKPCTGKRHPPPCCFCGLS